MKVLPLGEVCTLEYGKPLDKEFRKSDGAFQAYGANGPISSASKYLIEGPCVIVGRKGSAGEITYVKENVWPLDVTYYVKHDPKESDLRYLFYTLQNLDIKQFVRGVKPGLNRNDVYNLPIPLPALEKQREIVKKLDSAFSEIDFLEKNLKLSDDKSNELLQSLLSAEYSLEGIPVVPLEKLVDILDNQRIPINSTERLQRLGNVPYYGATGQVGTIDKAIFNETLILLGEDGVPFFDSTKHKAYEISGPAWVNNHAHVLRAKSEMVNQRYLLHFLNIFNYTGYVNGATRLKLTQGDMKRIPVPYPNMETQEKIVLKIDSAFEVIMNLTEQIKQKKDLALSLRHSLLGNAFTREDAVA